MLWWLRRAAAMGDQDVLLDLGRCYETGVGVPKNPAKAKQFYRRVVASTYVVQHSKVEAQTRLAKLLGRGVSGANVKRKRAKC